MIGYLTGKILPYDEPGHLLIDVSGVGYLVFTPQRVQEKYQTGAPVSLFIITNVRENALELFGFETAWEKKVFLSLTSVSGVGPRTALSALNGISADALMTAIAREDKLTLTKIPGVGKKTAERIVLELLDKATKLLAEREPHSTSAGSNSKNITSSKSDATKNSAPSQSAEATGFTYTVMQDSISALLGLGYRDVEVSSVVRQVAQELSADKSEDNSGEKPGEFTAQALVRASLQRLAKSKMQQGAGL